MLVDASHLWNVVYPDKRPGAAGFRWSGNPPHFIRRPRSNAAANPLCHYFRMPSLRVRVCARMNMAR